MNTFSESDWVTMNGTDYTAGRVGQVVAVDAGNKRARVYWHHDKHGSEVGRRTWVTFSRLEPLMTKCVARE